ncbi:MAG: hypothetical protein KBS83_00250 [Lachnospiraceae bacterium]|nr:hypothetical protein [Candidatus Equihabitans merdae]
MNIDSAKEHYKAGRMDKAFDECATLLAEDRHLIEAWGLMTKIMISRWNPGQESRKGAIMKGISGIVRNAQDITEVDRILSEVKMTIYDRKFSYAEKYCRLQRHNPELGKHVDELKFVLTQFDDLAGKDLRFATQSHRRSIMQTAGIDFDDYINPYDTMVREYEEETNRHIDELFVKN